MKSRIFVSFPGKADPFQILSIEQDNKGDIYCFVPKAYKHQFHGINVDMKNNEGTVLRTKATEGNFHLSVHRDGNLHVKKEKTGEYSPVLSGNKLADLSKNVLSVRHIFTVFVAKPEFLPEQKAGARAYDCIINAKNDTPFCLIFFAIPKGVPNINLEFSFHMDDINMVPPDAGIITSELKHHVLMMLAYKTKFMEKWPDETIVQYGDGYFTPFIFEVVGKIIRTELRKPLYKFDSDKTLTINLPTDHIDQTQEIND